MVGEHQPISFAIETLTVKTSINRSVLKIGDANSSLSRLGKDDELAQIGKEIGGEKCKSVECMTMMGLKSFPTSWKSCEQNAPFNGGFWF